MLRIRTYVFFNFHQNVYQTDQKGGLLFLNPLYETQYCYFFYLKYEKCICVYFIKLVILRTYLKCDLCIFHKLVVFREP